MDLSVGQQCPTLALSYSLFLAPNFLHAPDENIASILGLCDNNGTILDNIVLHIYLYHPLDLSLNYFHRTFIFSRGLDPYPT